MSMHDSISFYRPIIRAGVNGPDPIPLSDWTRNWAEARTTLLQRGLAFYMFKCLLVLHPAVDIETETTYE